MPGPYRVVNGCVYAICFNIVRLTLWKKSCNLYLIIIV